MLGNTPQSQTVLRLAARKSFAFGLRFLNAADESPVDLTGCTLSMVMNKPARFGGTNVFTQAHTPVGSPTLGVVQFRIQAIGLDQPAGEYPFSVTLVSALGYSTLILDGIIDLAENADPSTSGTYPGVNPSTNLAIYREGGGEITLRIDKVDGLSQVVNAILDDADDSVAAAVAAASAANTSKTAAAGSATAAATSATSALANKNAAASSATAASSSAQSSAASAQSSATAQVAAETARSQALAARDAANASAVLAAEGAAGVVGLHDAVENQDFVLTGIWDFSNATLVGAGVGSGGVQDIALDDDGVPYLTGFAGQPGSEIAFDTDGAPYLL